MLSLIILPTLLRKINFKSNKLRYSQLAVAATVLWDIYHNIIKENFLELCILILSLDQAKGL